MLEQQQGWLIEGLRRLYQRTLDHNCWPGEPLPLDAHGHPLTHEILLRLGVLNNPMEFKETYNTEKSDAENRRQGASAPSHTRPNEQMDTGLQTMFPLENTFEFSELAEQYMNDDLRRQSFSNASYDTSQQSYDDRLGSIAIDNSSNTLGGEILPLDEVGIANAEVAAAEADNNPLPSMFTSTHVQPSWDSLPLPWTTEMNDDET